MATHVEILQLAVKGRDRDIAALRSELSAAAIEAREAAVLIEHVSPSSSITVKESDWLDAAGKKLRSVSSRLAEMGYGKESER